MGEFKNGSMEGRGIMRWPNGLVEEGEYFTSFYFYFKIMKI